MLLTDGDIYCQIFFKRLSKKIMFTVSINVHHILRNVFDQKMCVTISTCESGSRTVMQCFKQVMLHCGHVIGPFNSLVAKNTTRSMVMMMWLGCMLGCVLKYKVQLRVVAMLVFERSIKLVSISAH